MGETGGERRAWREDSPDMKGRPGTESRRSVQDSSGVEKKSSQRVEREHDRENVRI